MVKRKSEPKKGKDAGYAARTSQQISDSYSTSSSVSSSSSDTTSSDDSFTQIEQKSKTISKPANMLVKTSKVGKFKKIKPGTRALKEIQSLQRSTKLLIPKAPFLRLVKEIIQQSVGFGRNYKITETALEALREASECILVHIFEDAYLLSLHAKRVTLMNRDMQLLFRVKYNEFSNYA